MRRSDNLTRRPGSSNWYYRESVPADLTGHLRTGRGTAQKEVWVSLRTADRQVARRRVVAVRNEQHRQWDAARLRLGSGAATVSTTVPSAATIGAVALDWAYHKLQQRHDTARQALDPTDGAGWQALTVRHERELEAMNRQVLSGDFSPWAPAAAAIIRQNGWTIAPDSELFELLCENLGRAARQTFELSVRRDRGDLGAAPTDPVVVDALAAATQTAAAGETLLDLFGKYEAQCLRQQRKSAATLKQERITLTLFAGFVGDQRAVGSISKRDIRAFRDALLAAPIKWTSRADCAELSLDDAVALAAREGLATREPRTVAREISALSTLFRWLLREGYVDDNPVLGLAPRFDKAQNKYPPFTTAQLNRIFAGPLYTGFARDGLEYRPGAARCRDWRFWIPLILLFTGARLGEAAQLLTADIGEKDGVRFFDITDDGDDAHAKSLKRAASKRVVPIHPALVRLGLLDHVEDQRRAGHARLFPELWTETAPDPSKFWRKYLKGIGVKQRRDDGLGAHSFRHTFTDECRERGVPDAVTATLLGHAKAGMTAHYGRKTEGNLRQRQQAIDSLVYDGLVLDHLYPQRRS